MWYSDHLKQKLSAVETSIVVQFVPWGLRSVYEPYESLSYCEDLTEQ